MRARSADGRLSARASPARERSDASAAPGTYILAAGSASAPWVVLSKLSRVATGGFVSCFVNVAAAAVKGAGVAPALSAASVDEPVGVFNLAPVGVREFMYEDGGGGGRDECEAAAAATAAEEDDDEREDEEDEEVDEV